MLTTLLCKLHVKEKNKCYTWGQVSSKIKDLCTANMFRINDYLDKKCVGLKGGIFWGKFISLDIKQEFLCLCI